MTRYQLIRNAVINKQQVLGVYHGLPREMCPHVIGLNKNGEEQALFYQFGGESSTGLSTTDERKNWRCILLSDLSITEVREGEWYTAPNHSRPQTCVHTIDVEVDF